MRGLDDLKRLTRGALAEMRTLLLELRPATLKEKPIGELIQQLAASTSGRTRIPVDVKTDELRRLPAEVQVTLYRTAQEALHNVVKHAEASHVNLELRDDGQTVTLSIRDDGRGLESSSANQAGMGLEIMRERVQAIGGILDIKSEPGAGATVSVQWSSKVVGSDER